MTAFPSLRVMNEPPRRYLALWFAFLPTERQVKFCDVQDEPLVLTEKTGNALRLAAVSRIAATMGLTPGLTLADARARIPNLVAVEADPDADTKLLTRLAAWADRFTPLVALDGTDGLMLDVTGCASLFGGEASLRKSVMMQVKRLGFSAKASLAGTSQAASALARFGRTAIVEPGNDAAAVAPLPISALGASPDITLALTRAGLKTVGDLAARPSTTLVSRFGADLAARLSRICGREDKRLTPLRSLPQCRAARRFAEPLVNANALEDILKSLLGEAFDELERRGEGGLRFEAGFFRMDGHVRYIAIETGRASRDTFIVSKLFAERMAVLADPVDPGFGFDAMTLSVLDTASMAPAQTDLENTPDGRDLRDLVDRLVARFGHERVQGFVAQDTHMPERAAKRVNALKTSSKIAWPMPDVDDPPVRPIQMFDPPHLLEVPAAEFPDGPPKRFGWRRKMHDVTAAEGPERIAPEWWRSGEETQPRDYFRVEDSAGRRFWIYRRGLYGLSAEPTWFLHGLFA